jgi:DNA-binding response OmpR family regulator
MARIKELDPTEDTISKLYALHDSKSITLTKNELVTLERILLTKNKTLKDKETIEHLWRIYAEVPHGTR